MLELPIHIREMKLPEHYIDDDERSIFQYPIIMKYLQRKIKGWSISDFWKDRPPKKIVPYAVTEFTELICGDWVESADARIAYIADQNCDCFGDGYQGYAVRSAGDLISDYQAQRIDAVLVCSIFHRNEIIKDLVRRGIAIKDIYSIIEIIMNER